jgi:hypothetical protein
MTDGAGQGKMGIFMRRHLRAHMTLRLLRALVHVLIVLPLVVAVLGYVFLSLSGKPMNLPGWAVTEVERRLNKGLGEDAPLALTVEGIGMAVDREWAPRLLLQGLRVNRPTGETLLSLPEARIALDPAAALTGALQPESITLVGAQASLRRDANGRFDVDFGGASGAGAESFAALLDKGEAAFSLPLLARLETIEAEAMSLTLTDALSGRTWDVGDGRLVLDNRADAISVILGMTLSGGQGMPARAEVTAVTQKGSAEARLSARVDGVRAADLAALSPPLGFLSVLDAPIAGDLQVSVDADGAFAGLTGGLEIGPGAVLPSAETRPVAFDRLAIDLAYDAAKERLTLGRIEAEGRTLRLKASAQVLVPGIAEGRASEFITQIALDEVQVDPEGLFAEPVRFSDGALDLRLRLDPFVVDIGQLALVENKLRLHSKGRIAAANQGWDVALDLRLNEIANDRLMALWPVTLVPKTREWLADNVQQGVLFDVKGAVRIKPGRAPQLSLGYEFEGTDVRFIRTLPPAQQGKGYATVEGNTFTMVLDQGHVTPPKGGDVDLAGTIFTVLDITQKPAQAEIQLRTDSSVTAALSLLDEKPFEFLTKAGQPVDLAEGRAVTEGILRLPLVKKVMPKDVRYELNGVLTGVSSDKIVPGKSIAADRLTLHADPKGMTILGPGTIGALPFDVRYTQAFGPEAKGKSRVEGTVELSPLTVSEFNLGLPEGMVSGKGQGQVDIALTKGEAPVMTLTSDLVGVVLALPEVGFRKDKGAAGKLSLTARLAQLARVENLSLSAPGLSLEGEVSLRAGGGLEVARFVPLKLGKWLEGQVTLTGQGAGKTPAIAVNSGWVDLRALPQFSAGRGGGGSFGTLPVRLDRLQVTESIALTGFKGEFTLRGGIKGQFSGAVNGRAAVTGAVAPLDHGTGVRILSNDAGGVMAAAGLFEKAQGGALDMQLVPTGGEGNYDGVARASNIRVQNAPILAEMLSAVSVIGLLEQLGGQGILFGQAEAQFRLTPQAVEISRASAIGASMGVSMAGLYVHQGKALRMQGVVSPIYLVNGIGEIFGRKGEGLFGFNYTLSGTADAPQVGVNPLSILTPGMFREIFRTAPPALPRG